MPGLHFKNAVFNLTAHIIQIPLNWVKHRKGFIARLLIFSQLLQISAAIALPLPNSLSEQRLTYNQYKPTPLGVGGPIAPLLDFARTGKFPSLSLTTQQLGMAGPLSGGVTYSNLTGTFLNAQYLLPLGTRSGLAVLGEYGAGQYRFGGTLGHEFSPLSQIKITAERLGQRLPFQFDTGNVEQRVHQDAYGLQFRQMFEQHFLQALNVGGYYAKAPNKALTPVQFISNGINCGGYGAGFYCENYRNIAGATSDGMDVGAEVLLTPTTFLAGNLYYDRVHYNTELTGASSENRQGLGGGIKFKQLLAGSLELAGEASVRELYNVYQIGINWLPKLRTLGLEFSLNGQHLVSHNATPNNDSLSLQVSWLPETGKHYDSYFHGGSKSISKVMDWIKDPAVHMNQVLAVAEQLIRLSAPTILGIFPNSGPFSGGNIVTITGTNFLPGLLIYFGGQLASTTVNSSTSLQVVVPSFQEASNANLRAAANLSETQEKKVSVVIQNPDGQKEVFESSYTYTTGNLPTINTISPDRGSLTGGTVITITGTNLDTATQVTFGGVDAVITSRAANQLQVTAPSHSAGTVDIVVITASGSATKTNGFTYVAAPTITAITPGSGSTAGNTTLTITGTSLTDTSSVTFGGISGTNLIVMSDTQITVVTPAHTAGAVDVAITTPYGTNTVTNGFVYELTPLITSVNPPTGSTAGGTTVMLTGNNFIGATAVTFDGAPTSFTVNSDTQITVTTPAHVAGQVSLAVTTPNGTGTLPNGYTYVAPPAVTGVSPATGSALGGTTVVLTGSNFTGASAVSFGGTAVTSFTVDSATQITVTTAAHAAGQVDVVVTTPYGTGTLPNGYTYGLSPGITSVSPATGSTSGGTTVVLTGSNFTGASAVSFGGTAVTSFTVDSATQITVTTAAHAAGQADVVVTTPYGTGTLTNGYTYVAPPTVTSVNPATGSTSGGTTVVLTGSNFTGASAVTFGGTAVSSLTVDSATQITVTTAAHAAGQVDVIVTTPYGTGTLTNGYTYGLSPGVTSVSPATGSTLGGTTVVLTGSNFTGASAVTFGGNAVSSLTVDSATQITVTTAAHAAGQVDVVVTTPYGTGTLPNGYTYGLSPSVTSVSPTTGSTLGGTTVVLTGSNFTGASAVSFGGTAVSSFTVDSATQITVTTAAHAAGQVDVVVTTPYGTGTLPNGYTYGLSPSVTSVSPTTGSTLGGTTVVLTGSNFTGASAVSFGGTAVSSFTVDSATQITVTTAAHAAGQVDVVVTTPYGTGTLPNGYTYVAPPAVTGVSPATGSTLGGTSVVLTGSNFTGASAVSFGGTAVSNFTVDSATQITVTTAAHAAGQVAVVVTTPYGTGTLPNGYTYVAPPAVTGVSPATGSTLGGTTVVLTGSNFTGASAVSFGGTAVSSLTVDSATQITVTTAAHAAGQVAVVVTTPYGTGTLPNGYTYVAPPAVTGVSPATGSTLGGTTVVLTGSNFTGASAVSFGGTAVSSLTVDSATQITVTTAAHAAGQVAVVVTTPNGTGTLPNGYTYGLSPGVTSVSPAAGSTLGGTTVVLTGSNFTGASAVSFGGTAVTNFTVDSATQITVTTAAHAAGQVNVIVTTPYGTGTLPNGYTYGLSPGVTSVSPATGSTLGGTTVVLTGSNFTGASAVSFGGTAVSNFTVDSATQITVTTAAHAAGQVAVVVTSPYGTGTLPNGYTYGLSPGVTSVSPATGSTSGGTTVVLTGSNFTGASAVSFGGTAVTSFTVDSATQITVTTGAHAAGQVNVVVTSPYGTGTLPNGYTYVAPPAVTGVSPATGSTSGGTTVVLTGSNFTGASAVSFGGTAVTSFTVDSATQITVTTGAHAAGQVNVVVTSPYGTGTLPNGYTYGLSPGVTSVSPATGSTLGGTTVVLTGSNFTGASAVTFGGTAVSSLTVDSATQITVTTAAHAAGQVDVVVTTPYGTGTLPNGYTYGLSPGVTSVSPATGSTLGGTTVVLTGSNFTGASAVTFGGTAVSSLTVDSATQITVTTAAHAAGQVDVVVTTPYGTGTLPNGYTYGLSPGVTSVSPTAGSTLGGTTVVLTGSNFTGASAVSFGGTAVSSLTVDSATQITVTTAAHAAGQVDVVVTTPYGTGTLPNGYTYGLSPGVTSVSPTAGSTLGGTTVVLTGSNFTGASAVSFGGTAVTNFTVDSATQITVTTAAHIAGQVNVVVTSPYGTGTLPNGYTYVAPPAVTGVSPATGSTLGGTTVVLMGSNFTGASAVSFGGTAVSNFTVDSTTQITVTTAAHAAGQVDVIVTTPYGTGTLPNGYTYGLSPGVTSVSPTTGSTLGGTTVVLTGSNFTGASAVTFGGTAVSSFTVDSATQITVTTAAHIAGQVNVVVTSPYGTGTLPNGYTYVAPPAVTGVSPATGSTLGGTTVVLTGSNFTGASAVSFGGTAVSNFTVDSTTQITVTTAAHAAGQVAVVVTTPYGTGTLPNGYTYGLSPGVTSVSPATGSTLGGTTVVLTGSNFTGASAVSFGGTAVTSFTVDSTTQITVTTAAHAAGQVDVIVTSPYGTGTLTNGYTYVAPPTITSVDPSAGPVAGSTTVTITGTNLTGTSSVTFGGSSGTNITVTSDTQVTVVTPSGTAGTVDVGITTPGGSYTLSNSYTYAAPPTITALNPTSGSRLGGTTVTITGTNLTGASSVTFGGIAGTSVTVTSDTELTVVTPASTTGAVDVVVTTLGGSATKTNGFTFLIAPPVIGGISPTSGSTAGNTTVTITGMRLSNVTSVTFDGTPGTSLNVVSNTLLTVVTPAHVAGGVDVVVANAGGSDTSIGGYTYGLPPGVTSVSPATGSTLGGTSVVLTGSNFTGASAVSFGGTAVSSFTVNSATQITVTTAAHAAGQVNVVVTTPYGTGTLTNGYTYIAPPSVTSVSPSTGSTLGGTSVVLTGSNFTGASAVSFGGTAVSSFTVNSATQITATTAAHAAGQVNVVVTTPYGTGTLTNGYTYGLPPGVTSVSPATGSTLGGTSVVLTGSNFTGASAVSFGGTAVTSFTVNSATQITVTTAAHAAGQVNVVVTTPYGTGTLTNGYTYIAPPSVTSVSPSTGSTLGGTSVVLTGSNFTGASAVSFGGTAVSSFTVNSATQITATTAAHAAGQVNVVVTTPYGTGTLTNGYTYGLPPGVTSVSPATGSTLGGTSVVLTGSNFTGASAVSFGGTAVTSFTVNSATQITVTTAAHAAGQVNVVVTTPYGTGTLTNGYTYGLSPGVTSISPATGSTLGGTSVVLTGSNFTGASAVSFGGTAVTSFTVNSATQITATTAAHAAGQVNVVVTTPYGTGTLTNGYTYGLSPGVTSVGPTAGSTLGGTTVVLTGSNFTGASAVSFGGTAVTSFTVNSATQITVTTAAHAAGQVNVVVTTPYGTGTLTNGYTYVAPPTITNISPVTGPAAGGATVTITGTNFDGSTSVSFGGTPSSSISVVNSTQLTAVTPAHASGTVNVVVSGTGGSNSLANAYTFYAIGDAYGGGAVYQVDSTYIYVVSLADVSSNAAWSQRVIVFNTTDNDGYYNTYTVLTDSQDQASLSCRNYSAGSATGQWFLPAQTQWATLGSSTVLSALNAKSATTGFQNLGVSSTYWTSSITTAAFTAYDRTATGNPTSGTSEGMNTINSGQRVRCARQIPL